jgi:inorganic pyrophosphatase
MVWRDSLIILWEIRYFPNSSTRHLFLFIKYLEEIAMILDHVLPGKNIPDDVNVIIEIPLHSEPVKYEVDHTTGAMFVDRFLATAMHYPCNYGYIPRTLCGDGDPVDVLVVAPLPLIAGSVVRCRPVGVLDMEDESGADAKILAVPIDKLTSLYREVKSFRDLPRELVDRIAHFFEHYKDLEPGKWVKITGWSDTDAAKTEILSSINNYKQEVRQK